MTEVAIQFKTTSSLPCVLARPKMHQSLEDMNDTQLMSLYHDITGDVPNDIFAYAEKEFTTENLCLLLHLCIMFANAAGNEQVLNINYLNDRINKGGKNNALDTRVVRLKFILDLPVSVYVDLYQDTYH